MAEAKNGEVTCGQATVYNQDIKTLGRGRWLTDNVISFAYEYLALHEFPNSKIL